MSPSRRAAFALVPLLALAACQPEEKPDGCVYPEEPVVNNAVVTESCGWYLLDVGDHLYVNLYVTEPQSPCELTDLGGGIEAADPIYSDMSNDDPKYTYDFLAQVPGAEYPIQITCEDGTTFEAKVDVR